MIYTCTQTEDLPDSFIDDCHSFLPSWRNEQMMRYRFPSDRKLCAVSYLLLVYGLKKEGHFVDLPLFCYDNLDENKQTSGIKPSLSNYPDIYFNLSHCQGAAACAISDTPVGIDIELVETYDDSMAKLVCNDRQYSWVNESSADKSIRLTEIWSKKESVVKCLGIGLEEDLHSIPIEGCSVSLLREGKNHYIISIKQKVQ